MPAPPDTGALAQIQESSVCAVNRQKDWVTQSINQTVMTTNLLLACPSVVEILRSHQGKSFTWQMREYIDIQLQNRADQGLEWIFFLKDHEMLFSHSPRSLKKFLPLVPNELIALSFEHGSTQSALGLFAIRLSSSSIRLLDSVNKRLEQGHGMSVIEAITIFLESLGDTPSVAYVPQWWLEVRGNCVEQATWEAQFGVAHVVETDRLCCVSDSCQHGLSQHIENSKTSGNQVIDSQDPLRLVSELSIEQLIHDFWTSRKSSGCSS